SPASTPRTTGRASRPFSESARPVSRESETVNEHAQARCFPRSRVTGHRSRLLLMALLLFAQPAWPQADYAREQRWAQEITPALLVGDPIRLEAAGRKFLAIYAPAAGPVAGVVVIHGLGVHPD